MKDSVICILGGAGMIGRNLITELVKKEPKKIIVLDNFSSGNRESFDNNIILQHINIYDREKVFKYIPDDTNYVFHLAAHFANQNSVDHPMADVNTNVIGTVNIYERCKELKYLKKVVYTSSSCVYGNQIGMSLDSYIYPHETPYAINKYTSELYTKYYSAFFPSVSIRIFNTYGPWEKPGEYRNVIPNFIHKAVNNLSLNITGSGNEKRDFTYVTDTITLIIKMAESDINDGSFYNGGTGVGTTILKLATKIIELTNSQSTITYTERRDWDKIETRLSDIQKTIKTFNYKPEIKLEDGLKKTIDWYKENF